MVAENLQPIHKASAYAEGAKNLAALTQHTSPQIDAVAEDIEAELEEKTAESDTRPATKPDDDDHEMIETSELEDLSISGIMRKLNRIEAMMIVLTRGPRQRTLTQALKPVRQTDTTEIESTASWSSGLTKKGLALPRQDRA